MQRKNSFHRSIQNRDIDGELRDKDIFEMSKTDRRIDGLMKKRNIFQDLSIFKLEVKEITPVTFWTYLLLKLVHSRCEKRFIK